MIETEIPAGAPHTACSALLDRLDGKMADVLAAVEASEMGRLLMDPESALQLDEHSGPDAELPDEVLAHASWPYACLTAVTDRQAGWQTVLSRYGLVVQSDSDPAVRHVRCRSERDGEHKRQALTLFYAGVELAAIGAAERLYLYQVSQLHQFLARASGECPVSHSPSGETCKWTQPGYFFTVDGPVALALEQAAIELPCDRLPVHIYRCEIAEMLLQLGSTKVSAHKSEGGAMLLSPGAGTPR